MQRVHDPNLSCACQRKSRSQAKKLSKASIAWELRSPRLNFKKESSKPFLLSKQVLDKRIATISILWADCFGWLLHHGNENINIEKGFIAFCSLLHCCYWQALRYRKFIGLLQFAIQASQFWSPGCWREKSNTMSGENGSINGWDGQHC